MISAEYLKDPPEREKILVEHSTKHTVVLKPGFYNRRNKSSYLKNSFPAGFQIKNKLTEKLGDSIVKDGRYTNPYGSFTDWTKGETDTMGDSMSTDITDPYADVAGPYLTEILANRPKMQSNLGSTRNSSMVASELLLHSRSELKNQKAIQAKSLPKPLVFHAPSSLPNMPTALTQNKLINNNPNGNGNGKVNEPDSNAYEEWLAFQRSDMSEKYWRIKGNEEGYNYSSHDFKGDRRSISQLISTASLQVALAENDEEDEDIDQLEFLKYKYPSILTELPKPLPEHITLEVHTLNQMIRTDRLSEEKHIVRTVDSHITLSELKSLITEDIISGVEKAFRLYENNSAQRQRSRLNNAKVELSFQCFSPHAQVWRAINNEADWKNAKLDFRDDGNALKVMYALEKKSEFLLLKEIQQSYTMQKLTEQQIHAPQISLKALTESMEADLRIRKKYVFTDSPPPSPGPGLSRNSTSAHSHSRSRRNTAHSSSSGCRARGETGKLGNEKTSHLKSTLKVVPPSPTYFLPLGQNAATIASMSGANSGLTSPCEMSRPTSRNPAGRLNDELSRTSSAGGGGSGGGSWGAGGLGELGGLGGLQGAVSARTLLGVTSSFSEAQSALLPTSNSTLTTVGGQGSKSIFYPKRSDKLDRMYEQLESSMPRQEDFANNLEQRLFKTRW